MVRSFAPLVKCNALQQQTVQPHKNSLFLAQIPLELRAIQIFPHANHTVKDQLPG